MSQCVRARIRWLSAKEGGRSAPPAGPRYSTAARFEGQVPNWEEEAWSLVAEFEGPVDETGWILADVRFLVPERAPIDLLRVGSRFELMEGPRVVATGEVID